MRPGGGRKKMAANAQTGCIGLRQRSTVLWVDRRKNFAPFFLYQFFFGLFIFFLSNNSVLTEARLSRNRP